MAIRTKCTGKTLPKTSHAINWSFYRTHLLSLSVSGFRSGQMMLLGVNVKCKKQKHTSYTYKSSLKWLNCCTAKGVCFWCLSVNEQTTNILFLRITSHVVPYTSSFHGVRGGGENDTIKDVWVEYTT